MGAMASQITSLTIVYSTVYSGVDQRKHKSSASLTFVRGIHRWPVNSPHTWPVTRNMFPFDDVNMSAMNLDFSYDVIWQSDTWSTLHFASRMSLSRSGRRSCTWFIGKCTGPRYYDKISYWRCTYPLSNFAFKCVFVYRCMCLCVMVWMHSIYVKNTL